MAPFYLQFLYDVATIATRARGVYLSEPLPYLVLSPLPVESSGIQWVMGNTNIVLEKDMIRTLLAKVNFNGLRAQKFQIATTTGIIPPRGKKCQRTEEAQRRKAALALAPM